MIQHALYVIASTRLRVGRNIPRYVGWRPAPRVEHDAAVAPSEIANLQLPTAIVASELVNEDDRSSAASFLVVELHIVVGGEEWHGLVSSLVVLRRLLRDIHISVLLPRMASGVCRRMACRYLDQLYQHVAGRLRIEEGNARIGVTGARYFVDQLDALALELGQRAFDILHLQADVEQALAMSIDPLRRLGIRSIRL